MHLFSILIPLLTQQYHFYDGAVIPIGLGLSLILNGIFLAAHINREVNILTLPDVHAKRYGKVVESKCYFARLLLLLLFLLLSEHDGFYVSLSKNRIRSHTSLPSSTVL